MQSKCYGQSKCRFTTQLKDELATSVISQIGRLQSKNIFGSEVPGEKVYKRPRKRDKTKTKASTDICFRGTGCRGCENLSKKLAIRTTELEVAATSIGQLRKELAAAKKMPKVSAESNAPEMSEKLRAANTKIATLNNKLAWLPVDEIAETRGTCGDLKKELDKTIYDQTVLGTIATSLVSDVGVLRNNLCDVTVPDTMDSSLGLLKFSY